MGVIQLGGKSDLAEEAFRAERMGELRMENLERHRSVVLQVLGEVDRGHPTAAELALDRVAVGEGGGKVPEVVGQLLPR